MQLASSQGVQFALSDLHYCTDMVDRGRLAQLRLQRLALVKWHMRNAGLIDAVMCTLWQSGSSMRHRKQGIF